MTSQFVTSSLTGASGLAVVRAILGGEREPEALLALCAVRIQRTKAARVKESLRGAWAEEHLFALRQAVAGGERDQGHTAACGRQIQAPLPAPDDYAAPPKVAAKTTPGKRPGVNAPRIPKLRRILVQMCGGQDLTRLPAHAGCSALQIVGEVGADLANRATEKHSTAWA